MTMEPGKSKIHRLNQQAENSGRISTLKSQSRIPSSPGNSDICSSDLQLHEAHPHFGGLPALLKVNCL